MKYDFVAHLGLFICHLGIFICPMAVFCHFLVQNLASRIHEIDPEKKSNFFEGDL